MGGAAREASVAVGAGLVWVAAVWTAVKVVVVGLLRRLLGGDR
jgi:hypothetical protein